MINENDFRSLLQRMENETLDFKSVACDVRSEDSRIAFVKDVVCMANTPREESSFIIFGVHKLPNGNPVLLGVDRHPDDADLQSQFPSRIYPVPQFSYTAFAYAGKDFGLVEILATRIGPCVPTKDIGSILRQHQVYFRRSSKNDVANRDDQARIYSWFSEHHSQRPRYSAGDRAWDEFLASVDNFDGGTYILIATPRLVDRSPELESIGSVPWFGVCDFDPDSDTAGLLAKSRSFLELRRSLHILTGRERPSINLRTGTYWFFARGLSGRLDSLEVGTWRDWQKTQGAALNEFFGRLAAACEPAPVKVVALLYDDSLVRHASSALAAILASFGNSAQVALVTDDPASLQAVAADTGATLITIPLHQLCAGLQAIFPSDGEGREGYVEIPSSSGAPIALSPKEERWYSEELDIVSLHLGQVPEAERVVGQAFLKGDEVSWYELGLHFDVDRDVTDDVERVIRSDITQRLTSRVNLYHAPGAGGTTVGRRVLWNLHRTCPCVILLRTAPLQTAERLYQLSHVSGLPVLLLVDGSRVSERQVDELYDSLRSRHVPVVILQVLRRFNEQKRGPRSFYLRLQLSDVEAGKFESVFTRAEPSRDREIRKLSKARDPKQRSAFYYGLTAFQEDFRGLESFVSQHINPLTLAQQKILCFISLAHHYAQQDVPAQIFGESLDVPANKQVELSNAIPPAVHDLLVQVDPGRWRTAHDLVATEVLREVLWPAGPDKRQWRQNLSTWAIEFAELCRGSGPIASDEMLEVASRMFIYRDNVDLLGTERSAAKQFAQLIEDIPSREGKLQVLSKLVELYPDEAHFRAHRGRFYSLEMHDHARAQEDIEGALSLDPNDTVLHHMRGMSFRQHAYEMVAAAAPLADVVDMAKKSSEAFTRARELNPDNEHAYISEVQMLARVLDYAGRESKQGVLDYLRDAGADPFLRDCLQRAEDLLERVRQTREGQGENPFEEDCRAKLDALYGKYEHALEIWSELVGRQDVYAPPLRRQMVWTYLARRGRVWDNVPASEIDRIVELLDQNIRMEPDNETNLRLWVQAVRRSSIPPPVDAVIERISYWRVNAARPLEAVFYLYALYTLEAMEGSALARESALRLMEESRTLSRLRRNRTNSLEWLGQGTGVARLVHYSQLGSWRRDTQFWEKTSPLARATGRIERIDSPQTGSIEVEGGVPAYFVPSRGDYSVNKSENQRVSFYLGFSYDGLRAWDVQNA